MKITQTTKLTSAPLFIFLSEKGFVKAQYPALPKKVTDTIKNVFDAKQFTGKKNEILPLVHTEPMTYLIGIGEGKDAKTLREASATAVKKTKADKHTKFVVTFPKSESAQEFLVGAKLGNYAFKIGDTSDQTILKQLTVFGTVKISKKTITEAESIADGICLARDLVNIPADTVTPTYLAQTAKDIGKGTKNMTVKVLGEKEAKKLKMGAFLAVGQGSDEESQFIIIEYKGGKKSEKTQAFVGKGISYDTGGYSLKPPSAMFDMKMDMGGAASVLGLFHWVAKNQPKQNLIGIIAAAENMVSGNAYRPGDILTAMNGQTIEIGNTDAEGRLVLADALHYMVTKYKPSHIIDIATLTGAVISALGYNITGAMTNDKNRMKTLQKAADASQEPIWELPITDEFRDMMKGDISDLRNASTTRAAGTCTAAAFLENFVGETPWIHLDIAGTAFSGKGDATAQKGATGVMVRTLVELVKQGE